MYYFPEADTLRYCVRCARWFHIGCLQRIDTVANLRAPTAPSLADSAWWIVWTAPAGTPRSISVDLERLVTLPIQRGVSTRPAGAHPLISNEVFSLALRDAVRSNNFLAAISTGGATQWLNAVMRDGLLDQSDLAVLEASAVVRRLTEIPLNDRVIYQCPIRSHHLL